MYAVIQYLNSTKKPFLNILHITQRFQNANSIAQILATQTYGSNIVEGVEKSFLYIHAELQYTFQNGDNKYVYAVVNLPETD